MKINGKNYYLKTLFRDDVTEDYLRWIRDPEVNKFLEVRFNLPETIEDLRDFVDTYDNLSRFIFGIYSHETKDYIGNIAINLNLANRTADYGYFIGNKRYWGTSAAIEAVSLVLDYSFDTLNLRKIWGGALQGNIGSMFNYMKLGFKKEGTLRHHYLVEDKPSDGIIFGILKEEWEFKREKMVY